MVLEGEARFSEARRWRVITVAPRQNSSKFDTVVTPQRPRGGTVRVVTEKPLTPTRTPQSLVAQRPSPLRGAAALSAQLPSP